MTFAQARELGEACGLELPCEWVNNVLAHACNLFVYPDIPKEEEELIESAVAAGVRFSTVCGDAIPDDASENEPCYICTALRAATERERQAREAAGGQS